MALCTVAQVKALISPKSVSDADITAIIDQVSAGIAARARATVSSTDANLVQAGIYAAAARVLQKAKFNGELAAQIQLGNSLQQNSIEADIQAFDNESNRYLRMYLYSSGLTFPYGRVGVGTVNKTGD